VMKKTTAITLGFWTAIAPKYNGKFELGTILDHSLPLTCLVLDYTFNQMPLFAKHAFIVGIAGFLYSMVNLAYVKF